MRNSNKGRRSASIFSRIWQWYLRWAEAMERDEVAMRASRVSEIEQEFEIFWNAKLPRNAQSRRECVRELFTVNYRSWLAADPRPADTLM